MTVNHDVAGSSPAGGATPKNQNKPITYSDFLTIWPVGQAVKTPPFHGGNAGSIPARVTNILNSLSCKGCLIYLILWTISSVG